MRLAMLAGVLANLVDPYHHGFVLSGLTIVPPVVGSPVQVSLTVTQQYATEPFFPDTHHITGVIYDPTTGIVILALDSVLVSLSSYEYTDVRLSSVGSLPTQYAGGQIGVAVGAPQSFSGAAPGTPLGSTTGMLLGSASVPSAPSKGTGGGGGGGGTKTPPPTTSQTTPHLSTAEVAGLAVGGALIVGGAWWVASRP